MRGSERRRLGGHVDHRDWNCCRDAETLDDLVVASVDHVNQSRLEPGCLKHGVYRDVEQPLRLFFYEEWVDRGGARQALRRSRLWSVCRGSDRGSRRNHQRSRSARRQRRREPKESSPSSGRCSPCSRSLESASAETRHDGGTHTGRVVRPWREGRAVDRCLVGARGSVGSGASPRREPRWCSRQRREPELAAARGRDAAIACGAGQPAGHRAREHLVDETLARVRPCRRAGQQCRLGDERTPCSTLHSTTFERCSTRI